MIKRQLLIFTFFLSLIGFISFITVNYTEIVYACTICCAPGTTGNDCPGYGLVCGYTNACPNPVDNAFCQNLVDQGIAGVCPNSGTAPVGSTNPCDPPTEWFGCLDGVGNPINKAACPTLGPGMHYGKNGRYNCGVPEYKDCQTCCPGDLIPGNPQYPADKSQTDTLKPILQWTDAIDWGFICPKPDNNQKRYRLLLGKKVNATCDGTVDYQYYRIDDIKKATTSWEVEPGVLEWGVSYCWKIRYINTAQYTDGTSKNINEISTSTFEFTPVRPDPYWMTNGGDTFIGYGVPGNLTEADPITDALLGYANDNSANAANIAKSRSYYYRNFIMNRNPFMSSNIFLSYANTNTGRESLYGYKAAHDETVVVDSYSSQHSVGTQRSFTDNFYKYFFDKFSSPKFSSLKRDVTLSTSVIGNVNKTDIRSYFTSNLQVKNIFYVKNSVSNNTYLRKVPASKPQTGFTYNSDTVYDLNSSNDWAGVSPGGNPNKIYCYGQNIFLVKGNLFIQSEIINTNENSSCIFIVEGHVVINIADRYPAVADSNYRQVDAMILSNSISITGKDDHGPVMVNGSIITNNTVTGSLEANHFDSIGRTNTFDVRTNLLDRPQVFINYDPRHLMIWDFEFSSSTGATVKESRYLKLIETN